MGSSAITSSYRWTRPKEVRWSPGLPNKDYAARSWTKLYDTRDGMAGRIGCSVLSIRSHIDGPGMFQDLPKM
jgi:hypothetical protein